MKNNVNIVHFEGAIYKFKWNYKKNKIKYILLYYCMREKGKEKEKEGWLVIGLLTKKSHIGHNLDCIISIIRFDFGTCIFVMSVSKYVLIGPRPICI